MATMLVFSVAESLTFEGGVACHYLEPIIDEHDWRWDRYHHSCIERVETTINLSVEILRSTSEVGYAAYTQLKMMLTNCVSYSRDL